MGIQVGVYTVEVTSIGVAGRGSFVGHWSIYKLPWSSGDNSVLEGETLAFDEAGSALEAAQNAGAAEARRLIAEETPGEDRGG